MKLRTYSDGGARGNPGPSAIGVLVCNTKDEILLEHKDTIGDATNNIAEYCAVIAALALANALGADEVEAHLDSELAVRQLGGAYRAKARHIIQLIGEVRTMEKKFRKVSYHHVPRTHEKLRRADKLVNQALDGVEA